MKVALEKPGTPDELVHHGVKGMHWGIRGASTREFRRKNPTIQKRDVKIERARTASQHRRTMYLTEYDSKTRKEMKKAYLNHPDRVTAQRLTSGEKAVLGVIHVFGPAALPIAPIVVGNVLYRHHIEKSQARAKKS